MLFDRAGIHARVAGGLSLGTEPRLLSLPRDVNAFADGRGRFFRAFARDVAVIDRWDFDMQIDPVEERTGNALPITLHLSGTATAFPFQVAEISTGAGMHCHFVKQHYLGFVAPMDHITSS